MKIQYCLPIIKTTKQDVLNMLEKHYGEYDFFEIWLDYIEGLDDTFLYDLFMNRDEKKFIFLFRRQNLVAIHMPLDVRKKYIDMISKTKSYLDLDIRTQTEEVEYIQHLNKPIHLIASYHNYEETPEIHVLQEIVSDMEQYSPQIYKISTFCKTPENAVDLLRILLEIKKLGKHCIILGMGNEGMITRIFGTLLGNELTFAPDTKDEISAPGQLTKSELEKIFEILVTRY